MSPLIGAIFILPLLILVDGFVVGPNVAHRIPSPDPLAVKDFGKGVFFSPDGSTLVITPWNWVSAFVYSIDAISGNWSLTQELFLEVGAEENSIAYSVAFSEGAGRMLVSAWWFQARRGRGLIYDRSAVTGQYALTHVLADGGGKYVCLSANGKKAIMSGGSKFAYVYTEMNGGAAWTLDSTVEKPPIHMVHPDGETAFWAAYIDVIRCDSTLKTVAFAGFHELFVMSDTGSGPWSEQLRVEFDEFQNYTSQFMNLPLDNVADYTLSADGNTLLLIRPSRDVHAPASTVSHYRRGPTGWAANVWQWDQDQDQQGQNRINLVDDCLATSANGERSMISDYESPVFTQLLDADGAIIANLAPHGPGPKGFRYVSGCALSADGSRAVVASSLNNEVFVLPASATAAPTPMPTVATHERCFERGAECTEYCFARYDGPACNASKAAECEFSLEDSIRSGGCETGCSCWYRYNQCMTDAQCLAPTPAPTPWPTTPQPTPWPTSAPPTKGPTLKPTPEPPTAPAYVEGPRILGLHLPEFLIVFGGGAVVLVFVVVLVICLLKRTHKPQQSPPPIVMTRARSRGVSTSSLSSRGRSRQHSVVFGGLGGGGMPITMPGGAVDSFSTSSSGERRGRSRRSSSKHIH